VTPTDVNSGGSTDSGATIDEIAEDKAFSGGPGTPDDPDKE